MQPPAQPSGPTGLYESHSHTALCGHCTGTTDEYVEQAIAKGLAGIIFTCHNPLPEGYSSATQLRTDQLGDYIDLVHGTRERWRGRCDVRLGLECDYVEGCVDFLREQTQSADFQFILGSVHPYYQQYKQRFGQDGPFVLMKYYFKHLADAAETGLFDSIAHPDLVKNMVMDHWHPRRQLDDIRSCLDRIAAAGTAIELNTSGLHKSMAEMNPCPLILREARERGIPVTLGGDAHVPERVGDDFVPALELLEQVGFEHVTVFLSRRPHSLPITDCLATLRGDGKRAHH